MTDDVPNKTTEVQRGPRVHFHYTDFDVDAVLAGKPLTPDEREFLVWDTPRFEEGMHLTREGLAQLSDIDLMREAYNVWADYARGQI